MSSSGGVPFPRGGAGSSASGQQGSSSSGKRPASGLLIKNEDVLFGAKRARTIVNAPSKKSAAAAAAAKKKSKESKTVIAPTTTLAAVGLGMAKSIANDKVVKIENLNFTKYVTGVVAYGYVLQVNDASAVVSLPGGVTGTVALHEVSDVIFALSHTPGKQLPSIRDVLHLHQPVCCYILEQTDRENHTNKKNLALSMRASLVQRGLTLHHLLPGFPLLGCISSREDHGYVVSAGISGVNFFLPFKALPSANNDQLTIGSPIDCIVDSVNEGAKTVTLRAHPKAVADALTRSSKLAFNSVRAGMLVNFVVDKLAQNGIIGSFLGLFHGVIDVFNLSRPMELSKWQKAYPVGTVLVARVVFVDHATKSVRLSLRPHVLEMRAPKNLPERGSLLTNISVRVMNKKIGVLLTSTDADSYEDEEEEEADEEGDGEGKDGDEEPRKRISKKKKRAEAERKRRDRDEAVQGVFIHRSSLAQVPSNPEGVETEDAKTAQGRDTSVETEQMEKTYPVGMEMSARVIGYHLVEGWAVASNMKSFMHADVVHSSQLHAGQVVEGTVQALKDFGIIVLIGGKVRAVCPALHLSDSGITGNSAAAAKAIAQKFKVGQTTRFRVWEATGDGFVLTCKKTLVNDTTSKVISSYDDAEVGMVVPGVIASINDDGLRVHFYNKVRGFVPMAVLVQQGVVDALDSFQVGQILRCVVLRKTIPREYKGKKPAKAKPYLTLGMDVGDAATNLDKLKSLLKDDPRAAPENPVKDNATSAARTSEGFNAYEFVSGTVTRQDDDSLFVQLDDSRVAVLSKLHLADSALTSKAVASSPAFAVGARVEDALLLSSKGKNIQISKKPLLVQIAKLQMASSSLVSSGKKKSISEQLESNSAGSDTSIPCRVSDLAPGQLVAGVVWNVESYGVLVKFRDNLTALAPRANLADKFVPTPVGLFEVGDSIRCAVQRVDYAKDRVIVTFKSAFVPPSRGPHCYLLSRLNDELRAAEASSKSSALPDWRSVAIGGSAHASVVAVKPYGVVLQAMSGPKKDSKALPNTMMLARDASDETFNRGDVAKVVVLDMDVKNNVFDVSLSSETLSVVEACVGKKKDKPRSALEVGAVVSAKILLVKEYYLVVITSSGIVGYVMVADYHCSKVGTSEYSVGQELSVCVEQSPSSSSQSAASPYTSSAMFSIHQSSDSGKSVVAALAKKVQREAEDADEELHGKLSSTDSKHHPKGSSLETLALTDPAAARQKFLDSLRIGSIMKWQVTEVTPLELHVAPEGNEVMGLRIKASVHITGAVVVKDALNEVVSKLETSVAKYSASGKDGGAKRLQKLKEAWSTEHPFYGITVGQKIGCRIVQIRREEVVVEAPEPEKSGKRKRKDEKEDTPKTQQQISVYLAMVSRGGDADKDKEGGGVRPRPMVQWRGRDGVKCSTIHPAFVVNVEAVGVVVALSPYVSARLSFMDISSDLSMVQRFKDVCNVGMSMLVGVTKVSSDNGKSHIEVSRAAIERYLPDSLDAIPKTAVELEVPAVPKAGAVVSGIFDVSKRVRDMPAFTIHLAHNRNARVCVTEVAEPNAWVDAGAVIKAARAEGGKAAAELAALAKTNDLARMHGSIVHARILSVSDASDNEHKVIEASTRESRVNAKKKAVALVADAAPAVGEVVSGFVVNTSSKGCFVRLNRGLTAQIQVKNLSDDFVENPSEAFPVGKLVKAAKVIEVVGGTEAEGSLHVHLSLRTSDTGVVPEEEATQLQRLQRGQVVTGKVKRIAPCGVFVAIDGTHLVGLSRPAAAISKGATADVKELLDAFQEGEPVRALVLGVSGRKISLGLKPSLFDRLAEEVDEDGEESEQEEEDEDEEDEGRDSDQEEAEEQDEEVDSAIENEEGEDEEGDDEEGSDAMILEPMDDSDDEEVERMIREAALHSDDDDGEEEEEEALKPPSKRSKSTSAATSGKAAGKKLDDDNSSDDEDEEGPPGGGRGGGGVFASAASNSSSLGAAGGLFQWDDFKPAAATSRQDAGSDRNKSSDDEDEEEEVSEDEGGKTAKGGQRSRQKEAEKRLSEEKLREREAALVSGGADDPKSPQDFEKKLLTAPNSSYLWVKYMALHLMAADVDAARAVAVRALRTIDIREEEEKYNVWVAYVNLEYKYGSMESLDAVFKRGVIESKGKYLHLHLAELYESAQDAKGAEGVLELALKKYKKSKKVWMAYQDFRLRQGDAAAAKALLQRSMQSLSRHKHIPVLIHYCQSEFEFGSQDRARVVFEELLSTYAKRTDIWHVYVDKEIKHGNIPEARALFQRMVNSSKLSGRNMKAVFKKYLSFETAHGTAATQEIVKQAAKAYVERLAS